MNYGSRGRHTETASARVAAFRYVVEKDGVVMGGHFVRASAEKLAAQFGGKVVVNPKTPKGRPTERFKQR